MTRPLERGVYAASPYEGQAFGALLALETFRVLKRRKRRAPEAWGQCRNAEPVNCRMELLRFLG